MTLTEKHNSHTKELRITCHDKLANAKMEPGQDQDDYFFILDERRALLQEMGRTMLEQKYEGVMIRSLAIEYEIVFIASYERRNFGLSDVRHTMYRQSFASF